MGGVDLADRMQKLMYGERLVHQNSKSDKSSEDDIVFEDGRKKPLPALESRIKRAKHLHMGHDEQQKFRMPKCKLKSTIFCSTEMCSCA